MAKTIKRGDKFILTAELPQPMLVEVVVLTNQPGYLVGVKLPYKVKGAHDLGGRVEHGLGWWCVPVHLVSEDEFKAQSLTKQSAPEIVELDSLDLDDFGRPVAPPVGDAK